jgi:hypothetical protein
VPAPVSETLNSTCMRLKVADTDVAPFIVTVHVGDVLEHAPEQLPNELLPLGVVASMAWVPLLKLALQAEPQFMPLGLLVTLPPELAETVNANVAGWGPGPNP